ncbi:MAG: hypothetical protein R3C44_20460 [Chloroflexota bacterium]
MNESRGHGDGTIPANDQILPLTKIVAAAVIPFLVVAFIILYPPGDRTGQWFAWSISPNLTAAIMGAGYLAGGYFFARALLGVRWHHIAGGFLPVTVFTAIMLAATLLDWDVFDPGHWPFWVWLALYIVTPVIAVPFVWWRNRPADPGTPDTPDFLLPPQTRPIMMIVGGILLLAVAAILIRPQLAIDIWPWNLSTLTARVMAGWQSLLGVGALTMAGERRWSGWRIPLQSIIFWQALVTLAFFLYRDDMTGGMLNWYVVYTIGGLAAAIGFTVWAEMQTRN